MKVAGLFDGIFWGVVLIALGAWLLVRRFVPVHIPVVRVLAGVLLVYVGIRVLAWGPSLRGGTTAAFSRTTIVAGSADRDREYNVIFASGEVDLRSLAASDTGTDAQVNVIFGSAVLRLDPAAPVRVYMSAAFGSVRGPDGRTVSFGDSVYQSPAWKAGVPGIDVRAAAVFGQLRIEQ
jgi:hypothetical protein